MYPGVLELQKTVFERRRSATANMLLGISKRLLTMRWRRCVLITDLRWALGCRARLASDLMNDGFWRVGEVEAGAAGIVLHDCSTLERWPGPSSRVALYQRWSCCCRCGRGGLSWAGPLVVGVAVLGSKVVNGEFPDGMRDSKALTERVRERVFDGIGEACSSWSTGWASAQECDELGMSEAQRLACERAFGSLGVSVDVAIVDGRWDFVSPLVDEVVMQVKADRECAACGSIRACKGFSTAYAGTRRSPCPLVVRIKQGISVRTT